MAANTKLEATKDKVSDAAQEAMDAVAAAAAQAEEQLRKGVAEIEERLKQTSRDAGARSKEMTNGVARYTRQHPLASLGIALATGFALAALLRR